jgi:hypothetical protein
VSIHKALFHISTERTWYLMTEIFPWNVTTTTLHQLKFILSNCTLRMIKSEKHLEPQEAAKANLKWSSRILLHQLRKAIKISPKNCRYKTWDMTFHSISCETFYVRMWSFQENTKAAVLWRGVYDYRIAPRIGCFVSPFKINWRRSQAAIVYCSDKFSI